MKRCLSKAVHSLKHKKIAAVKCSFKQKHNMYKRLFHSFIAVGSILSEPSPSSLSEGVLQCA